MGILTEIKPQEQVADLSRKVIGVYGPAGIGKSTLASCFPDVIFAATEAGLSHLENVSKVNITSWDEPLKKQEDGTVFGGFLPFCAEIAGGTHPYKVVCIDTFDNLTKLCTEYKCKELGIDDISDYKKFGAYHLVTEELHRVIRKLSLSKYGLILVSHVKYEEKESKTKKWEKATISVSGKNRDVMLDICDPLLFMDSEMKGDQEVGIIRTKPSMYWEAKDKIQALPDAIEYPLNNPKVAYDKIVAAFGKKGE